MGIKFTWYGHGTFGLETAGFKVLVDPFFTDNPAASTTADAVDPDFIVVSHGHGDHIADAADISKRTGAPVITVFIGPVPPLLRWALRSSTVILWR